MTWGNGGAVVKQREHHLAAGSTSWKNERLDIEGKREVYGSLDLDRRQSLSF